MSVNSLVLWHCLQQNGLSAFRTSLFRLDKYLKYIHVLLTRYSQWSSKVLLKDTASYNPHNRDILRQTYVKFNELVETDPQTFRDNGYTHAKLFSPFEFVATVVLISLLENWQDTEGLLSSIRGMRLALRRYLKDLRMNKDPWTVAWNYIEPMINQPRSQVPGSDGYIMESVDSERAHSVLAARLARVDHPVLRTVGSQNAPLPQPFREVQQLLHSSHVEVLSSLRNWEIFMVYQVYLQSRL